MVTHMMTTTPGPMTKARLTRGIARNAMTTAQIKRALRRNKALQRRPWSLYQIAQMKHCHRSIIIRAVNTTPSRYPAARAYVESLLKTGGA